MLEYSHNLFLAAASLAVAMMAGFTGFSLLRGASGFSQTRRKVSVAMASMVLGGGIWSMHFIAMLGVQLPIDFYYDPLITLMSALLAILVVGVALLILHFWRRTTATITTAGTIVGIGVLAMHYGGMSGIQRCLPIYSASDLAMTIIASISMNIGVFWIAYGHRSHKNILIGTVFFGVTVFLVHYIAMAGTGFDALDTAGDRRLLLSNETLAIVVMLGAFLICGAFLLTGVSYVPAEDQSNAAQPIVVGETNKTQESQVASSTLIEQSQPEVAIEPSLKIPYESDGRTLFLYPDELAAARAEGHYTILYSRDMKHFCPWPISQISKRLAATNFLQTHRSYLVNPKFVSGFERTKDNGVCYFDSVQSLEKVPVSRSKLKLVKDSLGLS